MRIGELASRVGVNPKTIRFYEEQGLLPPPPRRPSGYREYGSEDEARLRFVRTAQRLEFSLAEIAEILALRERGERPCPFVLSVLDAQLADIDRHVGELVALRAELLELKAKADHLPEDGACYCRDLVSSNAGSEWYDHDQGMVLIGIEAASEGAPAAAYRAPAPSCPEHPRGHTWHDGYYGKRGQRGYFLHPRFRCRPERDRPETHSFTTHRRIVRGTDPYCEYCERQRGVDEGPRTPQEFEFGIQEIATSLYDLATGSSYRGTSKLRRREIDRPARGSSVDRRSGETRYSNQGHLVRDWLEEFGPVVLANKEPTRWPRILLLDSKGYRPKLSVRRSDPYFNIYGALDGLSQQIVRLSFHRSRGEWAGFLDELPGAPEVVVADDAREIALAVQDKWPRTRLWRSHWHLQHCQLHSDHQPRDSLIPPGHRLEAEIEGAFTSLERWWAFVAACRSELAGNARLQRWLEAKADAIAGQVADTYFIPKSTGALEQRLRHIDNRIGERRGFENKARTDLLLRLWAVQLNHRAHLEEFIRKVRQHVEAGGGRVRPRSRPGGRHAATGRGHGPGRCRCLHHQRVLA